MKKQWSYHWRESKSTNNYTSRKSKQLRRSKIPIVKVRWNSKHGPEFTWERESFMKSMYPHLFTEESSASGKYENLELSNFRRPKKGSNGLYEQAYGLGQGEYEALFRWSLQLHQGWHPE
ncbi:hypothetical protein OSB04_024366 [Centaurea solstitialis]|uniref:Uncharacterized protein n=1 Tax=Centaurea solstitialis TaxID=347529 RepID=A0AA38SMM2_9ASTR|nr:hypothetical protein OSB04_024366 [Centaurea solstitialis]